MQESEAQGVPTRLATVLAVLVPLILATLFKGMLDWSNHASECTQWNTAACLALAARTGASRRGTHKSGKENIK